MFRFLCALLAAAAPAEQLLITNARVWTADPVRPWAETILVDGNRIAAVGSALQVEPLGKEARRIDAGGRLLVPGFIDAHIHFLGGSLGLSRVDLTGVCTLEGMRKKVAEYARANPGKTWITGRGWEYFCFPDQRLPRKEDLDAVVKDRPVFLSAYDGHTGWANSKALEIADINHATRFEGFGEIVKDAATGEPTGCLKEGAQSLVRRRIPQPTRQEKLDALRQGMRLAASLGITSIQNASGDEDELSLYEELRRNNELTLRVSVALSLGPQSKPGQVEKIAALKAHYNSALLKAGAVKLVMDGVIESHTAAMLEPYSNKPDTRGQPVWTAEAFNRMAARLDAAGLQIYTHAIGDRAVRMALDGYAHAHSVNGRRDSRFRIEHIETIHPTDVPRFAALGVIASMEPIHADPATVEVWSRAVGPHRLPMAFAWRSLQAAGARVVFSSDWPASISVDPIRGIHNAVNRRTIDGKPENGWIPAQRVSLETALHGYTTEGAYAGFDETRKGVIRAGMLADIVALSHDLFRIDPLAIHKTTVEWTLFDGRIIYQRGKP
jgi:hypothetical protein